MPRRCTCRSDTASTQARACRARCSLLLGEFDGVVAGPRAVGELLFVVDAPRTRVFVNDRETPRVLAADRVRVRRGKGNAVAAPAAIRNPDTVRGSLVETDERPAFRERIPGDVEEVGTLAVAPEHPTALHDRREDIRIEAEVVLAPVAEFFAVVRLPRPA